MKAKPIISYCRVSTGRQGKSGLGLDAQREAITRFAEAHGFQVVGEPFVEIETGKGTMHLIGDRNLGARSTRQANASARSSSPSSTGYPATCISSRA